MTTDKRMKVDSGFHRSWMFMPASQTRFLAKLDGLAVDNVMLDLEDGVPEAEKANARANLSLPLIRDREVGPGLYVRINSLASGHWRADLAASIGLLGVVVPKVESVEDMLEIGAELDRLEAESGLENGVTRVIAAIESARGLFRSADIASASDRMLGLIFGAEDFALDLRLSPLRRGHAAELIFARSMVVTAASSAGGISIDGVFPALNDDDGLLASAQESREFGFTGKSLFHPSQVALINDVFSPTAEELAYSAEVIARFDEAMQSGNGAVAVQGQLVDLPIMERARDYLNRSALLSQQTPAI